MVALGLPNVVIGLWAVTAPRRWYDNFPSSASPWISPDGPFNEHLVVDAGAGLLLLGVLLCGAAFLGRTARRLALVAGLFQTIPHVRYHLANPLPESSTVDQLAATGSLVLVVAAMVALLIIDRPTRAQPSPEGAVP